MVVVIEPLPSVDTKQPGLGEQCRSEVGPVGWPVSLELKFRALCYARRALRLARLRGLWTWGVSKCPMVRVR